MAGGRPKKGRKESVATGWLGWEYDYDKGCYVNSKINSDGEVVTMDGGPCPPPVAQTGGLEERLDQFSLSPDEPQVEGDEDAAQEEHMLPSSSDIEFQSPQPSDGRSASYPPFSSSPNSSLYSQRPNGDHSKMFTVAAPGLEDQTYDPNASEIGMAPSENIAPQGQTYPAYSVASYGRPRSGTALSQNSTGSYYPPINYRTNTIDEGGELLGDPVARSYDSTSQPTNTNFGGRLPPTGPANNQRRNRGGRRYSGHTNASLVEAKDTTTEFSSKSGLWEEFKIAHSSEFKERRVFKVVWTEPNGVDPRENYSSFSKVTASKHGELAYTSIRRFVVWKNYDGHAICLPVLTYRGKGTAKPGIKAAHHAIIFTESKLANRSIKHPPRETKPEKKLTNAPICVELMDRREQLDVMSRLNYAKVYTVEHNVKVCFIGKIHKDSVKEFKATYKKIQKDVDSPPESAVDDEVGESYNGAGVEGEENLYPDNRR
ncbi:hypothetical protein VE01_06731 [Pseudogymnoascus verrucosus]|uniref:DUF6590 domain-containing protein n=1 Tax=Pseudogymnoascus verrucosus TaxID=342668 RepID=A0A1B8GJH8_9PEZI|nr:uncharacterized protein VE01_06731 [Pseudogymnoascus verrucosus]OBT95978.2 hypothetical protein VE01_06731 [Pseudogymnoascus verrucosus]